MKPDGAFTDHRRAGYDNALLFKLNGIGLDRGQRSGFWEKDKYLQVQQSVKLSESKVNGVSSRSDRRGPHWPATEASK